MTKYIWKHLLIVTVEGVPDPSHSRGSGRSFQRPLLRQPRRFARQVTQLAARRARCEPLGLPKPWELWERANFRGLVLGCFFSFFPFFKKKRARSFSAVSKPNFARKYAFESSRRDLHDALLCTALQSHFFVKIPRNNYLLNFSTFSKISEKIRKFLAKF